jgi:hypothetical protein
MILLIDSGLTVEAEDRGMSASVASPMGPSFMQVGYRESDRSHERRDRQRLKIQGYDFLAFGVAIS